ncbi:MAG: LptA/OstA family protein, partial [Alphaproteobacteria bacterium]
ALAAAAALLGFATPSVDAQLLGNLDGGQPIDIAAADGIEWQRDARLYIARGQATARQGDVLVEGDVLRAHYREAGDEGTTGAQAGIQADTQDSAAAPATGSRIWRVEAQGNVVIRTPTETAWGDTAVYDVDEGRLLMTGQNLRLTTQNEDITARDSLEYLDGQRIAIARGDAVAIRGQERLEADILVAFFTEAGDNRVNRLEAVGHVEIRTPQDIVRGNEGVYDVDTGLATVIGSVRLTRGQNQLNGEYAVVDLNTGVSRLFAAPPGTNAAGRRVQGLFLTEGGD